MLYRIAPLLIALAALWAVGCGAPLEPDASRLVDDPVGAEQAVQIAMDAFGLESHERPVIYWYGRNLDCGTAWMVQGECIDGQGRDGAFAVAVGYSGFTWSESSLCHEMGHHYNWVRFGDPDAYHSGTVFADVGDVVRCESALAIVE